MFAALTKRNNASTPGFSVYVLPETKVLDRLQNKFMFVDTHKCV